MLSTQDQEQFKSHHLFQCLTEKEFATLIRSAVLVKLEPQEMLFQQNDPAKRFYFILNGMIRLYRIAPSGHEKVVDIVRADQCFAEALMFANLTRYPVTADAIQQTSLVAIENNVFTDLLNQNIQLAMSLLNRMSQRLHQQLNEIENLSLQNALHRLVNFLLREFDEKKGELELDIPKRLIASQLAIQPETLSRLLRKLCDRKIILVENNQLTLINKLGLFELASDNQPLRANE